MTRQVYLADRPQSFSVEDNETLLAAGLRHGLALPFGCQSGGCGSCRVPLIRGEIDYPFAPPALSDAERDAGYILMCLARAKTALPIALHQPAPLHQLRPPHLPVPAAPQAWAPHDQN